MPSTEDSDKIYFTLGVANVCTIAYGAGGTVHGRRCSLSLPSSPLRWTCFPPFPGHPGFLTYFYTMKFPLLIGIRYFFYKGRKWHLFLLDFCYFANLLLLAYLWLFNDRPEALMMIFGVTCVYPLPPAPFALVAPRCATGCPTRRCALVSVWTVMLGLRDRSYPANHCGAVCHRPCVLLLCVQDGAVGVGSAGIPQQVRMLRCACADSAAAAVLHVTGR